MNMEDKKKRYGVIIRIFDANQEQLRRMKGKKTLFEVIHSTEKNLHSFLLRKAKKHTQPAQKNGK